MCSRADSFGRGNSIFLSKRPDRRRAGSRISIRFVAAMTLTFCQLFSFFHSSPHKRQKIHTLIRLSLEKPSSWFNNSNIVLCTSLSPLLSLSNLFVPIASNSSMKMIAGAFCLASSKASRTSFAPSPRYIWTRAGPASLR